MRDNQAELAVFLQSYAINLIGNNNILFCPGISDTEKGTKTKTKPERNALLLFMIPLE